MKHMQSSGLQSPVRFNALEVDAQPPTYTHDYSNRWITNEQVCTPLLLLSHSTLLYFPPESKKPNVSLRYAPKLLSCHSFTAL